MFVPMGCQKQRPDSVEMETNLSISIAWMDGGDTVAPLLVDTVRVIIESPDLEYTVVRSYAFTSHNGSLPELPYGIDITVTVEGLDSAGNVIYRGSTMQSDLERGEASAEVTVHLLPPVAPINLQAQLFDFDRVFLRWEMRTRTTDSFVVERRQGSSGQYTAWGSGVAMAFTDSGLLPGVSYRYRISAANVGGVSAYSPVVAVTTPIADTTGPVITVISHRSIDTSAQRVISIYGLASDTNGIYSLTMNDSALTLSGNYWQQDGIILSNGANLFVFTALDNTPWRNDGVRTIRIYYNANYVDTVNHTPVFRVGASNLAGLIKAGDTYTRVLEATDRDSFNVLTYSVSPPLMLVDNTTIAWIPTVADTGIHTVYAKVQDQDGAYDSVAWTITVFNPDFNVAPVFLTLPANMTNRILAGQTYADTVEAMDLDQGDHQRYSITRGPARMVIDSITGIITWLPKNDNVGFNAITVQVRDDSNATASLSWNIEVQHPSVVSFSAGHDTTVSINDTVRLRPAIVMRTGSTVDRYEWDIGVSGTFTHISHADTDIVAPSLPDSPYVCVLRIICSEGDTVSGQVGVTVVLDPPVDHAGQDKLAARNETVNLLGSGADVYGTISAYAWDLGNTGSFVASVDGTISFIMPDSVLQYVCVLRVTDNDGNAAVDTLIVTSIQTTMVLVDQGTFFMGTVRGESDEAPVRTVNLLSFRIDSTEVIQSAYSTLMGVNPSTFPHPTQPYPVESVTWFDALLYCNAKSKQSGLDTVYSYSHIDGIPGNGCTGLTDLAIDYGIMGYRLPTEAEWEFACRANNASDTSKLYFWGNDTTVAGAYAVYGRASTVQVRTKEPNSDSLYDMAGNVWEWCNDWYGAYNSGQQDDPIGPATGFAKVIRGGSWQNPVNAVRAMNREFGLPNWKSSLVGFRTVLPIR